jgi:hypothetical protein
MTNGPFILYEVCQSVGCHVCSFPGRPAVGRGHAPAVRMYVDALRQVGPRSLALTVPEAEFESLRGCDFGNLVHGVLENDL